jgi:hypothetical protein
MDAVGLSVRWQRWATCGEISAVQASLRGTYPENPTPLSRAGIPRAFFRVLSDTYYWVTCRFCRVVLLRSGSGRTHHC